MKDYPPGNKRSQKAKAGRDVKMWGRDQITSTNISLWIPFFLIGILALGGLWAVNAGWLTRSGNPQQGAPQPTPTSTEKTTGS
ncbi:MAG: hypothetical protein IGS48_00860 [Oscillatoriales cyanobacterium C42_A2020_001]|nr:hypothetical protein [Leptolyngbyaceae cyanobacterium C42_A2020_001]